MKKLFILFIAFSIFGCGATIHHGYDEFSETSTCELLGNTLSGGGLLSTTNIDFNIHKLFEGTDSSYFQVSIFYRAESWLFIESGESLLLKIDGELIPLIGTGSSNSRDILSSGYIWEKSIYPIDRELLTRIANANEIKVRVLGDQYYTDRTFSSTNIDNVKKYINNCF